MLWVELAPGRACQTPRERRVEAGAAEVPLCSTNHYIHVRAGVGPAAGGRRGRGQEAELPPFCGHCWPSQWFLPAQPLGHPWPLHEGWLGAASCRGVGSGDSALGGMVLGSLGWSCHHPCPVSGPGFAFPWGPQPRSVPNCPQLLPTPHPEKRPAQRVPGSQVRMGPMGQGGQVGAALLHLGWEGQAPLGLVDARHSWSGSHPPAPSAC